MKSVQWPCHDAMFCHSTLFRFIQLYVYLVFFHITLNRPSALSDICFAVFNCYPTHARGMLIWSVLGRPQQLSCFSFLDINYTDAEVSFTQEMEVTRWRGRPRKGWTEEVERDLQVLGVRRWRELVIDRDKWRGIVRQAKAHSGQQRQRKKKKKMLRSTKDGQEVKVHGIYQIQCQCSQVYVRQSGRNIEVRCTEYMRNGWINLRSCCWQNIALRQIITLNSSVPKCCKEHQDPWTIS